MREWIDIIGKRLLTEDVDDDARYTNDGVTHDPTHSPIRTHRAGLWGSSHYMSSQMTGHSAKQIGAQGYRDSEPDKTVSRLVTQKLERIFHSPGAIEPLYHGFLNSRHLKWTVGEVLTLPLTATSGEIEGSAGYGFRIDHSDDKGELTVFEFPKGTRMVGYAKWKPEDAKEFGHLWMEAIVAGKFRIVSTRRQPYTYSWREDVDMTVVRLEPVAYFDPDNNTWVDA